MKRILLFMLVLFGINMMSAQNVTVKEITSYLNPQQKMRQSSENVTVNLKNLEDLTSKTMDAVYLNSGTAKSYGGSPRKLFTDVNSLQQITNHQFKKDEIKIVIITIKNSGELNNRLDMSLLSEFSNLKYIYFISEVNTDGGAISNMIINGNEQQYSFFFKIANNS